MYQFCDAQLDLEQINTLNIWPIISCKLWFFMKGMGGSATNSDPCYELVTCEANQTIDACANINTYATCETYLNYLNDTDPRKDLNVFIWF